MVEEITVDPELGNIAPVTEIGPHRSLAQLIIDEFHKQRAEAQAAEAASLREDEADRAAAQTKATRLTEEDANSAAPDVIPVIQASCPMETRICC